MKKNKKVYICQNCDYQAPMWTGQCPECKEWNTLEETILNTKAEKLTRASSPLSLDDGPKTLNQISLKKGHRFSTGMREFDRVLGGGLVQGSLILIGGEPGIGKSTLLTKIMGNICTKALDEKIFYISGEESLDQISLRAKRLEVSSTNLYLYHETN